MVILGLVSSTRLELSSKVVRCTIKVKNDNCNQCKELSAKIGCLRVSLEMGVF